MTDTTALPMTGAAPSTFRQNAANAAGAVASGSIASGMATAIKLELNRRGFQIDDYEALSLVPVVIVVIHPLGQIVNAVVMRTLRWLNQEKQP